MTHSLISIVARSGGIVNGRQAFLLLNLTATEQITGKTVQFPHRTKSSKASVGLTSDSAVLPSGVFLFRKNNFLNHVLMSAFGWIPIDVLFRMWAG